MHAWGASSNLKRVGGLLAKKWLEHWVTDLFRGSFPEISLDQRRWQLEPCTLTSLHQISAAALETLAVVSHLLRRNASPECPQSHRISPSYHLPPSQLHCCTVCR